MKRQGVIEIGHDGVWLQPIQQPTVYAGAYVLGADECWIWLKTKPTWLQRHLVEWLLGWRWVEVGPRTAVKLVAGPSTGAG